MLSERPTELLSIYHLSRDKAKELLGPDWKEHVFDKCKETICKRMEADATDAATAALKIFVEISKDMAVLSILIMATAAEMVEPE